MRRCSQECSVIAENADDDDADSFAPFPLWAPLSGKSVVAPVNVIKFNHNLVSFLNARGFDMMHGHGSTLGFIDPRFTARHDTALEVYREMRLVSHCSEASIF